MTDILILEDEESVNRGISFSLEKEGFCVRSCRMLGEARKALAQKYPDIVLCDVGLPDGNGLDSVSEVRSCGSAYIICLTAFEKETDQVMGYGAGADDYMTKPFSLAVLRARVNTLLRRRRRVRRAVHIDGYSFDFDAMEFFHEGRRVELSKTEQRLLRALVDNAGTALTRGQLVDRIWTDGAEYVDENALSVAVKRLRDKLEASKYIKTVYGIGYKWEGKDG